MAPGICSTRFVRFLICLGVLAPALAAKPRVIVLTDIGGDPDDEQSVVRLLACSNQLDLEGLIATTSTWKRSLSPEKITERILAYGQVHANLLKHDSGYPPPEHLVSLVRSGQPGYGMAAVGEGKSTAGSRLIIEAVDRDDPRPVWISIWGGANTLAQALWDVRRSRSPAEVERFVAKLRVFDICGQDEAGAWACHEFNDDGRRRLFWIRAFFNWQAMSYDVQGKFPASRGGDEDVVAPDWFRRNVQQDHGALGRAYPDALHCFEGDSPAFLHLLGGGLSDPEHPEWGGWGGRYSWMSMRRFDYVAATLPEVPPSYRIAEQRFAPYWMHSEVDDGWSHDGRIHDSSFASVFRWRRAYQHDFAARMDWCVKDYASANHHPVADINGDRSTEVLRLDAPVGTEFSLDASGTKDPDGNRLSYKWWVYPEPGTYAGTVTVDDASSSRATVHVSADAIGKTIHVILEVTDDGSPRLYSYRRAIITGREYTQANPGKVSRVPVLTEGVPNLILDTDFSPDTDDVGALAVLHALADRREVNILGVVTSMSDPYAIGAVDVVNTYYGRPDVPLGAYMGDFMASVPCSDSTWCPYAARLTREFPSDTKRRDQVPDAAKAYRKILSEQPDNSVTIATIGFLSNLDALLKSGPDEFSPIGGKKLIRQKVKLLVIGGSDYPTGKTYNLSHLGAGTWAQYVVHDWPGKITFCLNAVGGPIMTGSGLKNPSSNPVKRAYDIWLAPPRPSGPNRPSWDQAVVLYAVRGPASPLWEEVGPYENVFGSDGSSRFQSQGSGNDYFVRKTQPDAELKRVIEELMEAPPRS